MNLTYEAPFLRHFTARLMPEGAPQATAEEAAVTARS
jgi:hypothetical protein